MKFAQHSTELYPSGMAHQCRSLLRKMALDLLSVPMAGYKKIGGLQRPHLRIIHYHHVFEDEKKGFEKQLSFLKDHFDIKPLGSAIEDLRADRLSGPTLSIAFDDGFKNNATIVAETLEKLNLKACFYIVTDFISLNSDLQVFDFCKKRLRIHRAVENMTWEDIRFLKDRGHEIASHTVTHAMLPHCSDEELHREIYESKRIIEEQCGESVDHFGLPFGLQSHVSRKIGRMAKEAGYKTCAYSVRGPNLPGADLYQLRRDDLLANWSNREVMTHLLRTMGRTKPLELS